MRARRHRSQRPAAVAFLIAAVPLAIAVVLAGGALALAPLALLIVTILLTGRAPGIERLHALRAAPRLRRLPRAAPRPNLPRAERAIGGGLLIAASLAKRGPPLAP